MSDVKGIEVRIFDKEKVHLEKELGSGKFGKVYLATINDSKLPQVAIKIFRKDLRREEISQKEKDKAFEELLKLAVIDHQNVVKLHGMVQNELPWLVFEWMKDGNLLEYVKKNDNAKEKTLIRFCRDICSGMAFLHSHQVLHKDLAARNILLDGKVAKIADLGLSSFLTHNDYGVYALTGKVFAYRHAAIECIVEQVYTFETDVWSFGILMYEIFTGGTTPYGKNNKEPEVRRFIVDHITPMHILEPTCSAKVYSVMRSILNPVMQDRPTFLQLQNKFQKFLNGKPATEVSNDEITSAAFSAFHQIKANGLSSSISNLQSSPSTSSTHISPIIPKVKPKRDFLALDKTKNLKSSSTSDLLKAVGHQSLAVRTKEDNSSNQKNFLSVRSMVNSEKRHSINTADLLLPAKSSPLSSSLKEDSFFSNFEELQVENNIDEEPRRRANSSSRAMNPLLQGFVQNRFVRRKS